MRVQVITSILSQPEAVQFDNFLGRTLQAEKGLSCYLFSTLELKKPDFVEQLVFSQDLNVLREAAAKAISSSTADFLMFPTPGTMIFPGMIQEMIKELFNSRAALVCGATLFVERSTGKIFASVRTDSFFPNSILYNFKAYVTSISLDAWSFWGSFKEKNVSHQFFYEPVSLIELIH